MFRVHANGASMVGAGAQPPVVDRRGVCAGHRAVRARRSHTESGRRGAPAEGRTPGRKRLSEARSARTSGSGTDRRPERGRAARARSDSAGRRHASRRCCCWERPEPARNCSRRRSTSWDRAAIASDGARQLRRDSADADRKRAVRPREGARLPARWRARSGASRWPIIRPSFSTRLATCRSTCR